MPAAMVEKFSFLAATVGLWWVGRIPGAAVGFGLLDGLWGVLFYIAWSRVKSHRNSHPALMRAI